MRKLIALAAVLAASVVSLAAVPAGASPKIASAVHTSAITPDTGFTGVQLCDTTDVPLCMAGHNGDGAQILAKPFANGVAETVNVLVASNCGGTVQYKPNASPPTCRAAVPPHISSTSRPR